jgi:predicted Zn-dependent protease
LPYSLDSRYWFGGTPQTSYVDESGFLAFPGVVALPAQISTKAVQIFPNRLGWMQSLRPLTDAPGSAQTVALSARTNYFDPEVFGADVPVNVAGECPQRSSGRYHRALVKIAGGAAWKQAFGVDATAIPGGTR